MGSRAGKKNKNDLEKTGEKCNRKIEKLGKKKRGRTKRR